jgi:hypothetical protein
VLKTGAFNTSSTDELELSPFVAFRGLVI